MMKPRTIANVILAAGMVLGVGTFLAAPAPAFAVAAAEDAVDILILKNGTKVEGKIISETATSIRFKGTIGGIPFESEYQKSDVESIQRGVKKEAAADASASTEPDSAKAGAAPAKDATPADPNAAKVYIIPLGGLFGEEISETPILNAMRDATAQGANIIVLVMNAKSFVNPNNGQNLDERLAWDQTSRVEQIFPVFTEIMPKEWKAAGIEPPRVAFLCKRALGGAAFFPLGFKEVYFTSDGLMGGLGTLSEMFGTMGDDVVREKQRSLRLGHVEGWANYGGYNTQIVRAMARREFTWTMKLEGGKATFFERMPESPDEELLTDDGQGGNADNIVDYVEGSGNDVLTINARIAQLVGLSKGTVDTEEDLIIQLSAGRNAVVVRDRGDKIMKQWARGVDSAKTQILKLVREFQEVQMDQPPNYDNRTKYRGTRKQKLTQVKALLTRWAEPLGLWTQFYGIPGVPQLESMIKQIELQQMADRPDPK